MYRHILPDRVRLLVLGGGIHGVGVLHDLATRGWRDIHLVEKSHIAAGTSSKSTKLIHGGLRYLQHINQFHLVAESLRERKFLLEVAPDIVQPIELLLPVMPGIGPSGLTIKIGLSLYDFLSRKAEIKRHKILPPDEIEAKAPILKDEMRAKVYSFWDGQTDDVALVQRVAESAIGAGASITEGCKAIRVKPDRDGWLVDLVSQDGVEKRISAMFVVNCLGPWSNRFLQQSGLTPSVEGLNNKGIHLLAPDLGLKSGLFLQADQDRIFFVLPWCGQTLIGTTEEVYDGDLDRIEVRKDEIDYLLTNCNRYLKRPLRARDIKATFAGLRWLAASRKADSISALSRDFLLGEHTSERGLLLTIYGGKLTGYRALAEKIGDKITSQFGEFRPTGTGSPSTWISPSQAVNSYPSPLERFA